MLTPVRYIFVPNALYRPVPRTTMKLYVAVLCIVLLQGVLVNCQQQSSSYLDTAISTLNTVYQQYRSGNLLRNIIQIGVDFVGSIISKLVQLQSLLEKIPSLPALALQAQQSSQPIQQATQPPNTGGRGWSPSWSG